MRLFLTMIPMPRLGPGIEPPTGLSELKSFFMGQIYTDWLKTEVVRLKELSSLQS